MDGWAVNWAGHLHPAEKSEARGFCADGEIVLIILLKCRQKVLRFDVNAHHGAGMDAAQYTTDGAVRTESTPQELGTYGILGLARAGITLITVRSEMALTASPMRPFSSRSRAE